MPTPETIANLTLLQDDVPLQLGDLILLHGQDSAGNKNWDIKLVILSLDPNWILQNEVMPMLQNFGCTLARPIMREIVWTSTDDPDDPYTIALKATNYDHIRRAFNRGKTIQIFTPPNSWDDFRDWPTSDNKLEHLIKNEYAMRIKPKYEA